MKYRRNTAFKVLHHLLYHNRLAESGVHLSPLTPEEPGIVRVSISLQKSARHLRISTRRFDEAITYLLEDAKVAKQFMTEPGRITLDIQLPVGHT